jgi:hydrogenase maturation factor
MGEGALLITCATGRVEELLKTLRRDGIPSVAIGEVSKGSGLILRKSGTRKRYTPSPDGYWEAYRRAIRRGLG